MKKRANRLRILILVSIAFVLLSGCAGFETPYVNADYSVMVGGGYSDEKLTDTEYIVNYKGNVHTSDETLNKYLTKRASELCGSFNFVMSDPSSSSESQMIMVGETFVALPNPTNTVNVKCNTKKRDYLLNTLAKDGAAYCDIPIFNSTGYLYFAYPINVYVNNVYITAVSYKQYTVAPIPKGVNTLVISKPFSSTRKLVQIEISSCSEMIEVSHSVFEALKMQMHSDGQDVALNEYVPNIE